jgi:hypothetical protein
MGKSLIQLDNDDFFDLFLTRFYSPTPPETSMDLVDSLAGATLTVSIVWTPPIPLLLPVPIFLDLIPWGPVASPLMDN